MKQLHFNTKEPSILRSDLVPASTMYCVPFILQVLTGSPDLSAALGDQPVSGVYMPTLVKTLEESGIKLRRIELSNKPTVQALASKLDHLGNHFKTYLIAVRKHVLLLSNSRVTDNGNPNSVSVHSYSMAKYKVDQLWEVWK